MLPIIQEKLNALYEEELKIDTIKSLKDKDNISAPLLLNVYKNYLDSNIKIMYVGKETNNWLTHSSISIEKRGAIGVFKDDELDLDRLVTRYKKQMDNPSDWKANAFFKQYTNIQKQLLCEKIGNIVWNNLFKMSYDTGKGYSKNALGHSKLQEISKNIFLKELEILSPDVIVFVTGASYDKVIKEYFKDEYETIEIIIPRKIWKFKYKGITCYRTVHPDSIRFTKKDDREDYYQIIIDDIKKNNGL